MKPASALTRTADRIECVIEWIGRTASWLAPAVVILIFGIVVARYLFEVGSVAAGELALALHSAGFLIGAAFALKRDAHVRIDVLRPRFGIRGRAAVELLGVIFFLLPFAVFMVWSSWGYVAASWRIDEGSREPGGLGNLWLLKALIPVAGLLLALQGFAIMARAAAVLCGARPATVAEGPHAP
jgi:TRAP-type mannitol/chloroaromatic compound transport system permease small subunit